MIIWLASYPRSGNTALRTILHNAFGVRTYSLYDDKNAIGSRPALRELVGHNNHGLDQREFYARASTADELYFIKTHDAPQDSAKAIYIVRDGRAAAISYFHYLKDFSPHHSDPLSVKDIILGRCPFGSWSEHFEAWSPQHRPNTLLINYKDIATNPGSVVEAVAKFAGLRALSLDLPSFKDLQKADSDFFRSGSDIDNIAEMEADDATLFWVLHSELMTRLGYVVGCPALSDLPRTFRRVLDDLIDRDVSRVKVAPGASKVDRGT